MHHIAHQVELAVPADVSFQYVDNFDNVPKFSFGVKSFRPIGPAEPRLGSKLESSVQLGPVKFNSQGWVSAYVKNRLISVTVEQGPITGVVSWHFSPTASGGTLLKVELSYQIGGGLVGRALTKIIDTIIDPAIKYTESKLSEQIPAYYRSISSAT
ncbi:hypothetical protein BOO86_21800 [Mycobacterium sp. CBMA 234]|uniref:SRPBCC family protein n=1 Tax=Mycolicibacterium sp. CBMA 234 TaxID=1918495 RepID=UPI001391E06F|nr:SRPBCC family protein [Mycolicibacterium sp. CBMA 234]MUL67123.1 hypothetical protein [Mycolicibacterium sp. CBMA 234]